MRWLLLFASRLTRARPVVGLSDARAYAPWMARLAYMDVFTAARASDRPTTPASACEAAPFAAQQKSRHYWRLFHHAIELITSRCWSTAPAGSRRDDSPRGLRRCCCRRSDTGNCSHAFPCAPAARLA